MTRTTARRALRAARRPIGCRSPTHISPRASRCAGLGGGPLAGENVKRIRTIPKASILDEGESGQAKGLDDFADWRKYALPVEYALHDAVRHGPARGRGAVRDSDLGVDVLDVVLGGPG
jgi:hypothetical protein